MKKNTLLTTCLALTIVCAPGAQATHGHKKKSQPQESKQCDRQLHGRLEQCTRERDDARRQAHALAEKLKKAEGDLRNCRNREVALAKELEAMGSALRAGVGKRRALELELAKAMQSHSSESDKVKRLESALREHVARQK